MPKKVSSSAKENELKLASSSKASAKAGSVRGAKKPLPKSPAQKKRTTAAAKAGLIFPVARTLRVMRGMRLRERISKTAAVALAAAMEYLTAELGELAGEKCQQMKRKLVNNRSIKLALGGDAELGKLWPNAVIHDGGVVPRIEPAVLGKAKGKPGKAQKVESQDV